MSDDENSELNSRFNKFENTSKNLDNNLYVLENKQTPKRSYRESFPYNTKKESSEFPELSTPLNKTWSGDTPFTTPIKKDCRYSVNNRLKKIRNNLDESIKNEKFGKIGETVHQLQDKNCNKLNNSELKGKIYAKGTSTFSQSNEKPAAISESNTSISHENRESNLSKPLISTSVNIYTNLGKWASTTSKDKSSKRGLANERLVRLKKYVKNSEKDNNNQKSDNKCVKSNLIQSEVDKNLNNGRLVNKILETPGENNHVSPLLRGIKRGANSDNVFECSTPKKLILDKNINHIGTSSRSMKLLQSAINNENGKCKIESHKDTFLTPVPLKQSVSDRLNMKNSSISPSPDQHVGGIQSNKSTSSSNSKRDEKLMKSAPKIIEDDEYQEKMKMTANWVANHHLVATAHYNPFVDETKPIKCSQFIAFPSESQATQSDLNRTQPQLNENEVEDMEWTNAEPDEESSKNSLETHQQICVENVISNVVQKDPDKSSNLCIVVDTNIFIKNLSKLKDILNMKLTGPVQPVLYIPWMVVTELDFMKDSSCSNDKLKNDVLSSVKFINTVLTEKNERVVAQTVYDMKDQEQLGNSADDKIMSCCIFVQKKYETVILLSNDINLKNKAMIHGIDACSANEILMKIMSKLTRNVKYQKIHHKMSILCSSIICDCAKSTFGDAWKKMDMFTSPPWSLSECLRRFKKYWNTVFKEKLLKHFVKPLDETLLWLKTHKHIADDSKEYVKFVEFCITLCIHLRDIEESKGAVENTLKEITKIG